MKVKILFLSVIFALACSVAAFAGYKEEIAAGNDAYKAQDWKTADEHYRKAYAERPGAKLKGLIVFIEGKISKSAVKEASAPGKPFNWAGAGLVGLDALLAAGASYAVYDQQKAQEDYLNLYRIYNSTTEANYVMLQNKQKQAYEKMTVEVVAISAAAIAVIYTLGDIFITHQVFTADVRLKPVLASGNAGLLAERSF